MSESEKKLKSSTQELGRETESIAARHLESKNYQILARNWRTRRGEIDLICRDGDCLVFVEVKSSRGRVAWHPGERIDSRKRRRMGLAATAFLAQYDQPFSSSRFDAVLLFRKSGGEWRVQHIADAFQCEPEDYET